jgi:RNA polymerase sigma-70 factor (ECF subfamily)
LHNPIHEKRIPVAEAEDPPSAGGLARSTILNEVDQLAVADRSRLAKRLALLSGDNSMPATEGNGELEAFRDYLRILSLKWIAIDLRDQIDPSDLVQETMVRAHRDRHALRSQSTAEKAAWLREALANLLTDRFRELNKPTEFSHTDLDRSSVNMEQLCAMTKTNASSLVEREERAVVAARLLSRLPPDQAEAVVLKHCEGWPVEAIGRHMNRSPEAIGGLLKRGLRELRKLLETDEYRGL